MVFKIDDTKPSDSIYHRWSETSYDGAPDSIVISVPEHWHKNHDEHM